MELLFTFATISAALNAQAVFKTLQTPCQVIPLPRALGTSCTYALSTETEDLPCLCTTLKARGVDYLKVFRVEGPKGYQELRT
ncbi:DUF3343 domain-containing protein [Breznakiellaceae bacterium SP9]